MKSLITGGAGFIGSHLADRLLADGHEVTVLDDLSAGARSNLTDHASDPALTIRVGSVTDPLVTAPLVAAADVVFHLAARVGVAHYVEDPLDVILTNTRGTDIVLEAAARLGTKVLFASTSEVYGKGCRVPFLEDADRVLGPTTTHRWCYATAKALDEHLCMARHRMGLPVVIVRYFNAYGPRARDNAYGGVVTRFIRQALAGEPITVYGDGSQTRTFTYIDDIVAGTVLAGTHADAVGQVFNLGSEHEISVAELALLVKEMTASPSPVVRVPHAVAYGQNFEDIPRRAPSIARARRILGYGPRVSLREGLERTIAWYGRGPRGQA